MIGGRAMSGVERPEQSNQKFLTIQIKDVFSIGVAMGQSD
jgi:hypothetical protein